MSPSVRRVEDVSLEGFFSAVAGAAPGTEFRATGGDELDEIIERMTLAGLTNVRKDKETVIGQLPEYAEGYKVAVTAMSDLVDEDELLLRDGLPSRICPPLEAGEAAAAAKSGRKPCKDCSCGLAEAVENNSTVDTAGAAKSNCGSCSLGDAFRCAGCPYLGLPPFKPGEKIDISKQLMTSDI